MDRKITTDPRKMKGFIATLEAMLKSIEKIAETLPEIVEHFKKPENQLQEGEDPKTEASFWVRADNLDDYDRMMLMKLFGMVEKVADNGCQMLDKIGRGDGHLVYFYEKGLAEVFPEVPDILDAWANSCLKEKRLIEEKLRKNQVIEVKDKPNTIH